MWLRRLVGIMIVLAFFVMNTVTIWGLVAPSKVVKSPVTLTPQMQVAAVPAPTIELKADPSTISVGGSSALSWTTTGAPDCVATSSIPGPWDGQKTQVGAESTGRISSQGNFTYTLKCTNEGGSAESTATITVGAATAPKQAVVTKSSPSSTAKSYCGGRIPCYGTKDVAAHNSQGNCWGWNGDVVINISGFDAGYHQAKSGVSSIETSQMCGKDLAPALDGSISAGGQTRNHLQATKSNTSSYTASYFVGYYDSSK